MADDRTEPGADGHRRLSGSLFLVESAVLALDRTVTRASLSALTALAAEYCRRDRADEAVPVLEEALAGCRRVLGPRDPDTLVVLGNHAAALALLERWDEALPALRASVAARVEVLGDRHRATLTAGDALAVALRLAGFPAEASALHRRVADQRLRELGPAHPDTLTSLLGSALAESAAGRPDAAVVTLDGALSVAGSTPGTDPDLVTALRVALALCLITTGRTDRAVGLLVTALDDCERRLGSHHPDSIAVRRELAEARGPGGS